MSFVFKLGREDTQQVVHRLLFQIGTLHDLFGGEGKHGFGGVATDLLEGFDHPRLHLVSELVEIDILLVGRIDVAEDVDGVVRKHTGQLDVESVLTDGQRNLFRAQEDFRLMLLFVDADGGDFGRAECALNIECGVGGVVYDVDILVAQLTDDAADT